MAVVEPQALPLTPQAEPSAPSPMLRSEDGGVSHAPAFLQARPEPKAAEPKAAEPKVAEPKSAEPKSVVAKSAEPKSVAAQAPEAAEDAEVKPARAPRRRRAPRNFEAADGAGSAPTTGETEDA